jgi:hypothetical protein
VYQPLLRPEQVKDLYFLKLRLNKPMTKILRIALDECLEKYGGLEEVIRSADETSPRYGLQPVMAEVREENRAGS